MASGRRMPVRAVLLYPLSGLAYCGYCGSKMRAQHNIRGQRYYRCAGRVDWTNGWPQRLVNADKMEQKLASFLSDRQLPEEWQEQTVNAVGEALGMERLDERIKEIEKIIERLDFRWDMGFINQEEYIAQRTELKAQMAQLQPIPQDELVEAHRLLKNFRAEWSSADAEKRQRILKHVLENVWIRDDELYAVMLRPNYLVWIHRVMQEEGTTAQAPEELPPFLKNKKGNFHFMESCLSGSDGHRRVITICKLIVIFEQFGAF